MLAFVLTVADHDVELASDALWDLGVVAVEERSGGVGMVELWTALGDDPDVVAAVASVFVEPWSWRTEEIDEAVADTWRNFATAIWVEPDLVVRPAWIEASFAPEVTVLSIEPGPTLGMGDHPTTITSMRAIRRVIEPGASMLDVGCGSGVLSVAAVRFGARFARGIDIAAAAVQVTLDNAARNDVSSSSIAVDTVPLAFVADTDGPFDVVVANILAPTLVELAPHLVRVTAPEGALVISGILADRHDHVLEALAPMQVVACDELDGWVAITLRHPAVPPPR